MTANWKYESRMSTCGSTNAEKKKTRVSGVFRSVSTYSMPTARSTGTGETRNAASTVPIAIASAADTNVSDSVVKKPSRYRSKLSKITPTASVLSAGRAASPARPRWPSAMPSLWA
jgi:hypothetical protein